MRRGQLSRALKDGRDGDTRLGSFLVAFEQGSGDGQVCVFSRVIGWWHKRRSG